MKRFRLLFGKMVFLAMILLLANNPRYVAAEEVHSGEIFFRWAFAALKKGNNARRLISVTEKTVLKTGDKFKIFVQPEEKCFLYIFYHDPQGDINILFPYDMHLYDKDYEVSKKYYIPQGDMWFELDENTGLETFYLLASGKRLVELETLYQKYKSTAETADKQEVAERILGEIRNLSRQRRKLTTVAERPVQIGGSLRGADEDEEAASPDAADVAVEISASDLYSRTFTIDHQ